MRLGSRAGIFIISWVITAAALGAAGLGLQLEPGLSAHFVLFWSLLGVIALAAGGASFLASRAAIRPLARAAEAVLASAVDQPGAQILQLGRPRHSGDVAAVLGAVQATVTKLVRSLRESLLERTAALSAATEELGQRDELRARESRMALRMQRRIVPRQEELPSREEIAFGAVYEPCENTGGDLYDAVRAGKNGYTFLAADVSGRGVTAALIAALVKSFFRSRAAWGVDPAEVLSNVNRELLPVLGDTEHFVTVFYASLDLETGALSYASAGHPPALLFRRRLGKVVELVAQGPALGVIESPRFVRGDTRLEEGDRLLLFTDGVSEARNTRGEGFGRDRLASAFAKVASVPTTEMPRALLVELDEFRSGSPRSDDAVLLVCELRAFARPESRDRPRVDEERDWKLLARRGAALASSGKVEEAIAVYERLLELEPEDATALNNLGALFWRIGRRKEAAERFLDAWRIDPNDARIRRNLEMSQSASSRPSGAGRT
ncbi:MAG: SpoIIE family protein phosphatase [Rectinemataceae bacterium]